MAFTACQISRGADYALKASLLEIHRQHDAIEARIERVAAPVKCPSCGSHEWRQHNNVRICAYCRSGQ